jgi:hypothetical protein
VEEMSETAFSISKDGLTLPYLRFVSDSAVGFFVLLLSILSYRLSLSTFGIDVLRLANLSVETKVFFFLLLFILATPLGLFLNGLSWFILGCPQSFISKLLFKNNGTWFQFFIGKTKAVCHFDRVLDFFDIQETAYANSHRADKRENLYYFSYYLEQMFNMYFPGFLSPYDHVKALSRLSRSISLLILGAIVIALYFLFNSKTCQTLSLLCKLVYGVLLFIIPFCFMLVSSWLDAFYRMKILFSTLVICSNTDATKMSEKRLICYLIQISKDIYNSQKA